ncbi:hypothetical protein R5R35_008441 [Gryllus longicercus]|uniref:Epoxide hydrolase n=1 Tax=Gryllus longicercus TaxID=2509291 RepID=A0AAN9ZA76_9ORTH
MGLIRAALTTGAVLSLVGALAVGGLWHYLSQPAPRPTLPAQHWGPGPAKPDNPAVVPFKISASAAQLQDLRHRLQTLPALTPPLEDANFRYGFNSRYLQQVVSFWRDEYKWAEREAFLNALPQFKTQVGGLQLHFIHAKPKQVPAGARVLPLLLLHGWPGSVREFYELIPLLTAARPGADFVFEVVAPSLPGYGFSEGAAKQGLGPAQMGALFRTLMERLGHKQFFVHGGDWGHAIGSAMATLYPDSILGFHTTSCWSNQFAASFKLTLASLYPSYFMTDEEIKRAYPQGEQFMFTLEESGYFHIQATKPDTVGVALRDSPAGLAAYILEKFSTWTEKDWRSLPDGGLTKKFTLTKLLDNVMIYWISGSITTSMRLYSEAFSLANLGLKIDAVPTDVPTAVVNFPNELMFTPRFIGADKFKRIVHFSHAPRGGHFPALEEPQLLADDIWDAFPKLLHAAAARAQHKAK